MSLTTARLAALLLVAASTLAPMGAAAQAPYHHWRTLDTPHFRVHVAAGLEREGRVAGAAAEKAYAQLSAELEPPRARIELVVSDDADYSNGYATPFPSPRIVVFATPPIESPSLRLNEDWLGLVITHELTHIFHLDRVRGVWAGAQRIFGRAPFLFPHFYEPSWVTEGLAVYYESRLTEGGRLHDAEHRLIARNAALEGVLPRLGDLSGGSPRFPNGELTYAYGSLFVDWLARTRGDSTIRNFVDTQSGQVNPFAIGRASRKAFGISFADAFDVWRDSVKRSVTTSAPPLPGWRELSTHGYYAAAPRWLTDSSLVYVASDGRDVSAAYEITTSGARRRIGRRNSDGANVPLPEGGLLFAQLDYVGTSEVRSDLYVQRGGKVQRLTHGARLIQPDVRAAAPPSQPDTAAARPSQPDTAAARPSQPDVDMGMIVAVRIDAGRTSLVLLDRDARLLRVLREAGPDETWSEPRWSPDGRSIAVAHRAHGGMFSIEIISPQIDDYVVVVARERFLLSSPEWSRADGTLYFVSERSGTPRIEAWHGGSALLAPSGDSSLIALGSLASSPRGTALAAIAMRADGFHVGVAPTPPLEPIAAATSPATDGLSPAPVAQPLAPGEYADYSPSSTLLPRYWLPILGGNAGGGLSAGAFTSGYDALRRHQYSAYATVPLSGSGVAGAVAYRYAGLRRPFVDLALSQDWESLGAIHDPSGSAVGTLHKRTQDASLAATLYRPRFRTYTSLSMGAGVERRRYAADPAELLARLDPFYDREYSFPRLFVGGAWGNYQRPLLSISPEDGVALALTARERWSTETARRVASTSVVGTIAAYRSLATPGYAHSVLAMRLAGGFADANTPTSFEVGGTSGTPLDLVGGYSVGEGRRTFGVRGFPAASVYGTSAVAASLEYRVPLALGGRGSTSFPVFFDRTSLSAFADAGTATCVARPLYTGVCSPGGTIGHTIASVGAEFGISLALLFIDAPTLLRYGVAMPVAGRTVTGRTVERATSYVEFGVAF
jgi:hypothetical protein